MYTALVGEDRSFNILLPFFLVNIIIIFLCLLFCCVLYVQLCIYMRVRNDLKVRDAIEVEGWNQNQCFETDSSKRLEK